MEIARANGDQAERRAGKAVAALERKSKREARERIKTRQQWMREAQAVFNSWIRQRDKDLPCISCGTFNPNIQYAAGHYRTVGANPGLRFSEFNVNKQCNKNCNMALSGNLVAYRIGLLLKLGPETVAWLEGPHLVPQYTIDDLKQIKAIYTAKLKALKRLD